MLLRKSLRSKIEREVLSDLSQVLDDKLPVAARELRAFLDSDNLQPDKDALLTILNTGAVPSNLRDMLRRQYADYWTETLGHHVGDAASAGEAYTGLDMDDSVVRAQYVEERRDEWISLMADSQIAAYREVRAIYLDSSVLEDDAQELMALATGLSPQDAGQIARRQVSLLEEVKKVLGTSLLHQAMNLIRGRAVRTAEFELARAYNEAKQRAWSLAERLGLKAQVYKTWVTAEEPGPDSRVCPLCTALNRKRVPVRDEFEPGISSAPRHIRCRCTVVMGEKG